MGNRLSVRSALARAALAAALVLSAALPAAGETGVRPPPDVEREGTGRLHVPSPDWRDQIVYFLMIDRFDDGDPRNNDQHAGEYDPADPARFSGGDLKGVARRLDYIRGLGATAVWITPPVANQWWNEATHYGGYHGYWTQDFKSVDAHFGTLGDYRDLSRAIHAAGMYLIQDVVVNHTANYSGHVGGWDAKDPSAHFVLHPARDGRKAPTREPFAWNDARDPRHRAAAIYHWTPDIHDFTDREQELNFQLAGLDDLNTENAVVRDALRDAYGFWIREAGVDAFRVDTAFYVPQDYFHDFLHAADRRHPGVLRVAAATGRENFHVFGEGFAIDKPYADTQARKIDSYMRDGHGGALLPGMINFPLYGTLLDVFARGRPTAELGHRIDNMMEVHAQPWLMPTFVDNHDVERYLSGGSEAGLKQALLALMTLPGIPTIYYGTEQGFTGQRTAMFAGGHGANGRDHFDAEAPLYRYLQRVTALRRAHRLFSRGTPAVLAANAAAPGAFAYRMEHDGEAALVVFNTSDRTALLDHLDTGAAPGSALQPLFAIEGEAPPLVAGAAGRASIALPPHAGYAWKVDAAPAGAGAAPPSGTAVTISLAGELPATATGDFDLHGTARGTDRMKLVIDGDLAGATPVVKDRNGRWRVRVDTRDMVDPAIRHTAIVWDEASGTASPRHTFQVAREWQPAVEYTDSAGDDAGPQGRYTYPDDAGWRDHRPADLREVKVWTSGGALKVRLRLHEVVAAWNPPNGFDHVAFTLFLQLPGREGGARTMPQQNAMLPEGMRWHYRLRAHGWSNALFDAREASEASEGTVAAASAQIDVDRAQRTVTFTFPARVLGQAPSLSGAKLYVSTWDYDGGFRPLAPQARANAFGGGAARDPLVMDDTAVITLP